MTDPFFPSGGQGRPGGSIYRGKTAPVLACYGIVNILFTDLERALQSAASTPTLAHALMWITRGPALARPAQISRHAAQRETHARERGHT